MKKKHVVAALSSTSMIITLSVASAAWGQAYPSKPIRIILPVPPGGVADVAARPLAHNMTQLLGQQVILDYRPGATGAIGLRAAASAPPDGYTLVWGSTNTMCMGPAYYAKTPPINDFTAISPVIIFHNLLVVHPSLPVSNTAQLIKLAKSSPGTLNFASAGTGSVNHLAAGMFQYLAKIKINHVPYKGGGPALTDIMGGHVEAMFATGPSAANLVKDGKLKALMVTSATRVPALPAVPSAKDAGLPELVLSTWNGVLAPAGTPQPIVNALHGAIIKAASNKEMADRMTEQAAQVYTLAPEKFATVVRDDYAKWAAVVKATGITGTE
ncbi:MAG: Bug family tripartite tricarboxylate transporter substrate binding protein [Burkholderiales bacterium]